MRQTIRLTESDLHKLIKSCVDEALNELGDTQRGQYALGRLAARQNQDGKLGGGDTSQYASQQRNKSNDQYAMNASYENGQNFFYNSQRRNNGLNDDSIENKDGYYDQRHFG